MQEPLAATFRQLAETAPILFYAVDTDLRYTYINPFFAKTHAVTQQDAVGRCIAEVIGEDAYAANLVHYRKVLTGSTVEYESFFIKLDGNPHHYRALYVPLVRDGVIQGFTGVVADITPEKDLDRLSKTDTLTGLHNRRGFEECLGRLLDGSGRVMHGLIFLDIDFFKNINDRFGHDAGDRALIRLGRLLGENVPAPHRPYRIGGEEFAVLFQYIKGKSDLLEKSDALRKMIETADIIPDETVTVSIGATMFNPGSDRGRLLKRADIALYLSKDKGRNQVRFVAPPVRRASRVPGVDTRTPDPDG